MTRQQAAIQLGLRSEFKVRQFERDGRLHAVRGRMGTAFYPEAEVLALRAEFDATPRPTPGRWTDADLIALLRQPTPSGRLRTAVDLVTEAKINIARAERVYRFWSKRDETLATRATSAPPPAAAGMDSPSASERRSAARLAHDGLVRSLRNPDPRIRAQAFANSVGSPPPWPAADHSGRVWRGRAKRAWVGDRWGAEGRSEPFEGSR